jgi:hypothetical protein
MKRKVGDKVKIKNNLSNRMKDYVEDLEFYKGQEAIITEVYDDRYSLDIDNGDWWWYEGYFEKGNNLK